MIVTGEHEKKDEGCTGSRVKKIFSPGCGCGCGSGGGCCGTKFVPKAKKEESGQKEE